MGRIGYFFLYLCLSIVAVFQIFPIIWLFLFSLKDNREIFAGSPFALPSKIKWENYLSVWEGGIGTYFFNSVWITGVSIFLTLLFGSMAVFVITRMNWKLNKFVLGLFMVGLMIPIHSALIPLFSMFLNVNLIDNPWAIVLTYTAYNLPITMMILLGFYYTIPREIEEAAIIDGASLHRLFFTILLPISAPILSTTAIINMIYNWNEFVFVNTFISSDKYKTLTVGIQNFVGQYMTDWGAIGATLVISVLPILIAFLFFSNKIVEGISSSAVKG
ncbi:carbohydrate ABC transporter permease [Alkalihalophilus marmarensis]|jgi:raffinose/stachyose/melibiose transport system permease protein|uniref:Sugar ABC transporter permease n=1 Tax=Alkalihalophilus marmarensis DSM 21297 TaxID=1188261 RepID=U6SW24_9BACI|nr:carbohydrate ABC transporter permease [Alkalihalophilus marmarensis]ERN55115.1 sugar ABC transporter permease [Alkalihalophilus marmarensis DSM 21297]MCM3489245.1 carbohydrate ABC transporter permease [Alkalihalophilus marmarensis]